MATLNGQQGFYAKRTSDSAPIFISVGDGQDIQEQMNVWKARNTYSGNMAGNNVEWVGDNPDNYKFDIASGNINKFTPKGPDVVNDTYFDNLMKMADESYSAQRGKANQQYTTLLQYIKEDRELFDEDQSRTYAKTLQKVNENAYARGVGDSGIKEENITDTTQEDQFKTKQQNVYESQKKNLASQDLQYSLGSINRAQNATRESLSRSPYANYAY